MKISKTLFLLYILIVLVSCSKDEIEPVDNSSKITKNTWVFDLEGSDNNKFDIFCPFSKSKTPLIIAIHGGVFVGGDKADMYPENIGNIYGKKWVKQFNLAISQVAYATINYSLVSESSQYGIEKPLYDIKRMLHYFRQNSKYYNIDVENIYLFGASAGASAALWLGLQDDGIKGIICFDTQASLDYDKWADDIYGHFGYKDFFEEESKMKKHQDLHRMLYKNGAARKVANLHFINLINESSPEIYLVNSDYKSTYLHHISHTMLIEEVSKKRGSVVNVMSNNDSYNTNPEWESVVDFCVRKSYFDEADNSYYSEEF